ncbi:hypothetical protein ACFQBQ_08430 [Granulicella cerasi]|uniref:Outer membrane protein beta-barrel domain-containing protein n=1 Tax=Granulicella cerasi TaxID=741063 RepID=A0ABW1ZAN8_9BACT|nr:hypothetical protein [Granulicella cerasi]
MKSVLSKQGLRVFVAGALVLAGAGTLAAQKAKDGEQPTHKPVKRARRETNASREARIQRTITATYSHRWEVFGGGGYMRFRSGENTQKNNEVTWNVAAARYLNPRLAIVGDARGMFGNAHAQRPYYYPQITKPQINEYTFMGGVNYRIYGKEKLAIGLEALGGAGWGLFSGGSKGINSTALGIWPDGVRPAFSGGVNFDYNFYPNLAFRLKPTYVPTTFGGSLQNNFGVNMGVVYRFGKQ